MILFKLKKRKWIVSIFTAVFLVTLMTGTAFAKVTSSSHLDYVALGDSIPAGYGVAAGSEYPDLIAAELSDQGVLGNFDNFAASGWTSQDVLDNLADQTQAIRHSEILTITAGANDVLPSLELLNDADPSNDITAMQAITAAIGPLDPTDPNYGNGSVHENISGIITAIKSVNKNDVIYVMGYYDPFAAWPPSDSKTLAEFLIAALNANLQKAAAENGAIYVPTTFNPAGLNPADPDHYLLVDLVHPNALGQTVLATYFWTQITGDFVKTTVSL